MSVQPSHLQLWAKSPPQEQSEGYPLLPHLLDVAAVASVLQKVVPCPVQFPCPAPWVTALVGFHDLGKATPGFQKKLGRSSVPTYPPFPAAAPDRHDASTIPLLTRQLHQLGVEKSNGKLLARAVGAHHGQLICSTDLKKVYRSAKHLDQPWCEAHKQIFTQLREGVGAHGLPALPPEGAQRSAFLQWLMGLTTVADWIGSSEALCRWDRLGQYKNPALWFTESQKLAAKALHEVGLDAAGLATVNSGNEAIALALGDGMEPRPLQQAMAWVLDQLDNEPCLVVIEAPMGEGKTEAGFSCAPGHRGMYVAMPTQATSNALFTRISQFLERAADGKTQLALAHGAGGPAAAANRLRQVGLGTTDSAVKAGWWFRGSKRSLLCPQGVGTVDQALIGVLNARHSFVRLFGLSGRTVILDEVHAYDAYTGGLIERLVSWLQQLGCPVVLMSATLPSERRDAILRAWAGEADAKVPSTAYPRISWASPDSIKSLPFSASRSQKLLVQGIDPDDVAARATAMAKAGARVLLVVNTVARAQKLYCAIIGVDRTLFHGRFPMSQRLIIEQGVLKKFGPDGDARAGHVLVATQVAEQSLDIDMDVLITDPAPIDLVLQRAGRIHRHDRQRPPGFEQPLVLVSGLDQQVPPKKLSIVYDRWIVLRSHAWLKDNSVLNLPDHIDLAVQQVYGEWEPTATDQLLCELNDSFQEHEDTQQNMTKQSRDAALAKPGDWDICGTGHSIDDDAAESGEIQFGTRLGRPALSVIPVFPSDLESLTDRAPKLAENWLSISHKGLICAIRNAQPPAGWSQCPGLAHHHALRLDDNGVFQAERVTARLEPDLGLVID